MEVRWTLSIEREYDAWKHVHGDNANIERAVRQRRNDLFDYKILTQVALDGEFKCIDLVDP